jgi:Cellulase (glycosyl hydrolase family 5)
MTGRLIATRARTAFSPGATARHPIPVARRLFLILALAVSFEVAGPAVSLGQVTPVRETDALAHPAVSLHPENLRYFLFRGRPLVLVAATEHYGSVINRPFDFERYLADAADKQQTMTRTFLLFREQQTARNPSSPCKPESPDFITPWPRTGPGNAIDGEARFDLDQWNPEYFQRLHRFLSRASERGIVVELTLFSNTYGDSVWALNPLRSSNNLQGVGKIPWFEYTTLHNEPLVQRQLAYVKKIVEETSRYDNVYYEICNEPGGDADPRATATDVDAWQERITRLVRDELARVGRPHLVFGSQAFHYKPTFRQPLDQSFVGKTFDAVNVHPLPGIVLGGKEYMLGHFMSKELVLEDFRDFCRATQAFRKPCVPDEDNTASMYRDPLGWTIHRKRAWIALFSQCHYDYIDFSITVGSETGTRQSNRQIRMWMKHLSDFMQTIDFIHANPAADWITQKPQHLIDAALALPGGGFVAYLADDREVGDPNSRKPISGTLTVRIPPGSYQARFYSPTTGVFSPAVVIKGGDAPVSINLAPFEHDLVIEVTPPKAAE